MKKIILIAITLQFLSLGLYSQTTSKKNEVEKLREINRKLVSNFKKGEYKDAQKKAQQVVALSKSIYGDEHIETAASYRNLGEIYRVRKKYDEAVVNFDKSLAIYQKDSKKNEAVIFKLLESKATALAFDGKKKQAEDVFEQYIALAEKKYGKESEELLPYLKKQQTFYFYIKDFDKADDVTIRHSIIVARTNRKVAIDNAQDDTICYLHQHLSFDEILKRGKKISDAVSRALGEKVIREKTDKKEIKRISGGVVNGKAKYLAKPRYPIRARKSGVRGKVLVKIVINEKGKVINAKAFCGHPYLREAGETAAKKSTFSPTKLEGKAVEVSGIIAYAFN